MALEIITRLQNNPSLNTPATIMKVSLVASFLFHIALLLSFQKAFPIWNTPELRTYNVEIIRPPTEGLDKNDIPGSGIKTPGQEEASSKDSQDTISLDTKDKRYIQYTGLIKQTILKHWDYPDEAKLSSMEGNVLVLFSIMRNGKMTQIDIESSSGHNVLDKEVVRAVKASVPFPSFPQSIKVNRLNIKAKFNYRLSSPSGDK
jgi:TonB family protein